MTEQEQRAAVVAEARRWIGTPFHMNAAIRGVGVDCGRLLTSVYGSAGVPVPDFREHWPEDWALHRMADGEPYLAILEPFAREIEFPPQAGDIAMFRVGRAFSHSLIVTEWPLGIHAMWKSRVEYTDASQEPLASRAVRFFSPWVRPE